MGWGRLRWWSFGPDKLTVFIALGEYAYKARLSIEYTAYVCVCDAGVAPGCVDGDAHLVFVKVGCPIMESHDA